MKMATMGSRISRLETTTFSSSCRRATLSTAQARSSIPPPAWPTPSPSRMKRHISSWMSRSSKQVARRWLYPATAPSATLSGTTRIGTASRTRVSRGYPMSPSRSWTRPAPLSGAPPRMTPAATCSRTWVQATTPSPWSCRKASTSRWRTRAPTMRGTAMPTRRPAGRRASRSPRTRHSSTGMPGSPGSPHRRWP